VLLSPKHLISLIHDNRPMGIIVGIDASRGRSGGAKAHLIGIIKEMRPISLGVDEVHIWAFRRLLNLIPEQTWLIKHNPPQIERSLFHQIIWQRFRLTKEIEANKCDVLLSIDAGTVYVHHPSVVMSRDMLSFERTEINRYRYLSPEWLRLFLLRFVQIRSLKKADGALFLTKYASVTIQKWTGPIKNVRIIPHGVSANFKNNSQKIKWPYKGERPIHCLYVSNTALYKHQWHVISAISILREQGYNIQIELVGGGIGPSLKRLNKTILKLDPTQKFTLRREFVEHNQLPEILGKADLFVFASSCENMPNTLVEAMACGLPIACSDRGPMPEVLRDGGIYFNPEDPQSIARAIKDLINNSDLRTKLSLKTRQYSQEYSWSRCASETLIYLVDVYKNSKQD
jgi:glycosyltransferase involved in cell wall biosynthesis